MDKNRFMVFDTEDDSMGNIYWIVFFDGKKYYSFDNCGDGIKFISKLRNKKIYAVNLEYDLCNLFKDRYEKVNWNFGATRLIYARYKTNYFYDTYNQWKISVKEMGQFIKLPKKPFNPKSLTYCKRDCLITYKFLMEMVKRYDKTNIPIKSTIASSSIQYWKHNFWKKNFERIDEDYFPMLKQSYYGGRTEIYFVGVIKGNIHYVDFNSLYPYTMLNNYPLHSYISKTVNLDRIGATKATVKSNMKFPILPYRNEKGKLLFPNGKFTGTWINEELKYFKDMGGKILQIHNGFHFPFECYPFKEFVETIYKLRQNCKDKLMNFTYKIIMNSLYGKFGQGNKRTYLKNISDEMFYDKKGNLILPDNAKILFDKLVSFTAEGEYPEHTNYIWSALTTARGRIKLHKLIVDVALKGGKVIYCDTDSIVYIGKKKYCEYGKDLGELKYEGNYRMFNGKSAKFYMLDNKFVRLKGVPKKKQKQFFNKGKAKFKKPLKLKEAIRRGLSPNIWETQERHARTYYDKGVIGVNGDVIPFVLNQKRA